MANVAFNVAKGTFGYYCTLPGTNDSLIAVPIETTGIVADSIMIDYANLSLLLAGASNEQTTMGRKTLSSVTSVVNNTTDSRDVDCGDVTWSLATGNGISALVICYIPDTTAILDTTTIPLFKYDYTIIPDGSDVVAQINALGLATAV